MSKRDQDERNLYILNVRDPEDMQTNSVYWRTGPDRFRNLEDNRSGGPENQWTYCTELSLGRQRTSFGTVLRKHEKQWVL
jgi:hypothetical protein